MKMAQLLEGKVVAAAVIEDLKRRIAKLKEQGVVPGLATILVGDDSASAGYVRKKHEACEAIGIKSFHKHIDKNSKQSDLMATVKEFNDNPEIHGYIIQYPVPEQFDFAEAMSQMKPEKDADGLHPNNLGKLVLQEKGPIPATPAGIKEMLIHYNIPTDGREVVVVGRGTTLGRPLALLLSEKAKGANAAVTVVHSAVKDISYYTKRADILIAAVGRPSIIMPDMVKKDAVVISGGISWKGKRLLADVDESVGEVASWITPRLGGVGPTTIAMLLRNTVEAAERAAAKN
ncbi:MAG TPA: bifunctional 5,10-methylenetetrahydrofolate dehydrogenase/5,10-methenyltetrahydrofolate cyclohydrolase [Trueperaceae bacterium]|nr:bifunctional 5,10-methylenetetrahydrofolate dehydrogenase/5,10-methenyltetrahydrofolate cyclohydrolase [Trueperaceae bacterium]